MTAETAKIGRPDAAEYSPFYAGYIANVPEEPLLAFERQSRETATLLAAVKDSAAGHRYAEGKWTVRDVVQHMSDTERVMSYRALRIARGDDTPLPGFEENRYAVAADASRRGWSELVAELAAVRAASLALFRSFDAAAWRRWGTASGGPITVRALGHIIVGHERHHLEVLRTRYQVIPRSPAS